MKHLIYADNAATTQLDMDAFEAMKPYLLGEYGNASQPYSFARTARKALQESRRLIAECIGALPEEIFFTSGGTESDNWAIKGSAFSDSEKRTMITSTIEHHAILRACADIERLGYPVTYLSATSSGTIDPSELSKWINEKTRLVSIMMANNEIGSIQDISALADIAHSKNVLFHTDAVQAVGHWPIDVAELDVDMLSASAHKFNGPKGIGFLYVRKGTIIRPYCSGGGQELGMRAGTENIAAIVGMATALKKNISELAKSTAHLQYMEDCLINGLRKNQVFFIRNGSEKHIPGNISLSFAGYSGESLLHRLDLMGICVSTGSACDGNSTQISHVLQAIGLDEEIAKGTIRISLGKYNTEDDVNNIVSALVKIIAAYEKKKT
ncbi:cysteine desulfurase family protein [Anaerotignum lactatifermentans]|uniref:cysteine desulfurase family protein n=1 Tax=Anaerotignum lactatifermentans TaxID=160404 RepID=UPI001FA8DBE9|nr:cysteine desulfurase family protein [Anaerotignum lactatifermentans]